MPKPRIPLAEVVKTYSNALSGARVCTGATTADGKWGMEQLEDDRTTWFVVRLPDVPEGKKTVVSNCRGTLNDCRAYIAGGYAQADLDRLQAHERGEHRDHDPACAKCRADADRRFSRHEGVHQMGGHRRRHDPECTLCSQAHRRAA